jgi:N-acetylmuramoyl-L-alanine amidase
VTARSLVPRLAALAVLLAASSASAQVRTIVIDPGHGGQDPGGTGTGLQEKNIVLDVGNRFKQLLDADTADAAGGGQWVALSTRTDDTFVSLAGRAAFANERGADRFMSIHSNAFADPSANGTETFAFAEGGTGAALRNLLQEEMIAAWGRTNRGNKVANFAVLRETAMPAELHELAFITNGPDAAFLASAEQRQIAAVAHLRAIQRHFGIAPYLPGSNTGSTSGELAGRVIDEAGPVEGATVALDGGAEVVTPADGTFVFTAVPVGTRSLQVTADGYEPVTFQLEIAADQRAETEIVLERSGGSGDGSTDDGDGSADDGPADDGSADDGSADGGADDSGNGVEDEGGCRAGGGAGSAGACLSLLVLVIVARSRGRRARRAPHV